MEKINVIRKVVIKSIVTDELKRQLDLQLKNAKNNTDDSIKALEKQKKALEKKINNSSDLAQQQTLMGMQAELNKNVRYLNELDMKKKEYDSLKNGQEFMQGIIDSPVDLKLGDSFFEKLSKAEIILHDGEIVEIRNY